jgi:O-antigen/teichoic acid export membrane protein
MASARLDQFVMSAYATLAELGMYAVAVSYATVLFSLSGAFAMVLFPQVAAAERSEALGRIWRVLKLSFVATIPGAAILGLACPLLLPWLFGAAYQQAVYPAVALLGGAVLLGANYILSDGLRGLGMPSYVSIAESIGALTAIGALAMLLPSLGIWGATIASVTSYSVVCMLLSVRFLSLKLRPVPDLRMP